MDTFLAVLRIVGFTALGIALVSGLFIGLMCGLDRWVGLSDRLESDDEQQKTWLEKGP